MNSWIESYNGDPHFLEAVRWAAASAMGPILCIGSGAVTSVIARVATQPVLVLEEDEEKVSEIEAVILGLRMPNTINIKHAPIEKRVSRLVAKPYPWFSGLPRDDTRFDLVVVTEPLFRDVLLASIGDQLDIGATILMDHAVSRDSQKAIEEWNRIAHLDAGMGGEKQPYAQVVLMGWKEGVGAYAAPEPPLV